jgi:hypothetical protein
MAGDYEFLCNMYGLSGASGTVAYLNVHTLYTLPRSSLLFVVCHHIRPIEDSKITETRDWVEIIGRFESETFTIHSRGRR